MTRKQKALGNLADLVRNLGLAQGEGANAERVRRAVGLICSLSLSLEAIGAIQYLVDAICARLTGAPAGEAPEASWARCREHVRRLDTPDSKESHA
jgi:hypothetical protein